MRIFYFTAQSILLLVAGGMVLTSFENLVGISRIQRQISTTHHNVVLCGRYLSAVRNVKKASHILSEKFPSSADTFHKARHEVLAKFDAKTGKQSVEACAELAKLDLKIELFHQSSESSGVEAPNWVARLRRGI